MRTRGGNNEHFELGWNEMKNVRESEILRSTRKMGEKYARFLRVRKSYERLKGSVCQSLAVQTRLKPYLDLIGLESALDAANDLEWRRVG